jgi:Luciferase-like monooxygenase
MELSVHFIDFLPGAADRLASTVRDAAVAADEAGATMFTLADHFFQMEGMGQAQDPFLEAYTTLGFLAGQTRRIALAALVTGVTYRYPGVLAKTATTVDVLYPVSGREPTIRDARRDAADLPADVERRRRPVRRQALSVGRNHLPAPTDSAATDPDRR